MNDFKAASESWLAAVQAIINENYAKSFPNLTPSLLTFDTGGIKYIRVIVTTDGGKGQRSSFAFLEVSTGNVLKCAGWKTPAKHARGNIYTPEQGTGCGPYGPHYMSRR